MFQPSGPDHVLINTEQFWFMAHQKWRWVISQNIKRGYKEKVRVTTWTIDLLTKTQIAPQGLCFPPCQDPKIPLLHCPELLLAELFSSSSSSIWLGPRFPESADLPSTLQAMGATWLSHGLEDRVGIPEELDTSSLCDKTAIDDHSSPTKLSMLFWITCDKTAIDDHSSSTKLSTLAGHRCTSHSHSSGCPHWYVCPLTKFIFGIHPSVRI